MSDIAPARRVVVFSGHMTDAPQRPTPRFPGDQEAAVREAIDATLRDWQIGPGDLCLSGAARGGDILFTESCLAAGADVRWLLPLPIDAFLDRSVRGTDADWEARFRALLDRVTVRLPEDGLDVDGQESPFERGNDWLVETARAEAVPGLPLVMLVWDGQQGDGPGGTADVAAMARDLGWQVVTIDPGEA